MDHSTQIRLTLFRNGYYVVPVSGPHLPIKGAGKRVILKDWKRKSLRANEQLIRGWSVFSQTMSNTGIYCRNVCAVDIDIDEASVVDELVAAAKKALGGEPLVRVGQFPRTLLLYRCDTPMDTQLLYFNHPEHGEVHVDILGSSTQFVAFGDHPAGSQYRWVGTSPLTVKATELPPLTDADVNTLEVEFAGALCRHGYAFREVRLTPTLVHRIAAEAYRHLDRMPLLRSYVDRIRPGFQRLMAHFETRPIRSMSNSKASDVRAAARSAVPQSCSSTGTALMLRVNPPGAPTKASRPVPDSPEPLPAALPMAEVGNFEGKCVP